MNRKTAVFPLAVLLSLLSGALIFSAYAAGEYDCTSGKHKYIPAVILSPTTDQDGETRYTCDLCGHYYLQVTPATGHQWGEWIIDKEPTCALPGQKHRSCTATSVLHSEYAEIAPFGHDYKEIIKEPSCTAEGLKTYTCSHCSHSYAQPFGEAAGHKYNSEITTPAAKDKEGVNLYTCELCNDSYTEPMPYRQYEITEEIKADCEHKGKTTYTCRIYGDTYSEDFPATGHQWGEWITQERENLTEDGRKCRICVHDSSHIETQVIPAGITMEITPVAVAVNIGNVILIVVSAIILFFEYSVLSWERKERKKRAEHLKNGGAKT